MKNLLPIAIFLSLIFTSCDGGVFMTDRDFVEFKREYSPDSTKILLLYGFDRGAFGFSSPKNAVLNLCDTAKDLRDFTIKKELIALKWVKNDTITGGLNIMPYIRSGTLYDISSEKINNVIISISPFDYIEPSFQRIIEYRVASPDEKHELVAYRYCLNRSALNFIHVSVIEKGQEIPKYGNYFIGDMTSDYIFDAEWTNDNSLIFYTNKLYEEMVQYFFVSKRPNIKYALKVDDGKFANKYRWQLK